MINFLFFKSEDLFTSKLKFQIRLDDFRQIASSENKFGTDMLENVRNDYCHPNSLLSCESHTRLKIDRAILNFGLKLTVLEVRQTRLKI